MIFRERSVTRLTVRVGLLIVGLLTLHSALASSTYTLFESGQVRPLALSANGKHLYAVNTPDARLEIFRVTPNGLKRIGSVTVGLEPVAVSVRGDHEVWVVNHLSDSVSVVDVGDAEHPRVVRTLLVGDEPRDILFAGPRGQRAFITTAHRGQNSPIDPQLTTPGVGRADVWVFDANNLGNSLGGTPLNIITLFTDTPRALAVTPDGARVYAAGFHTGNRTTTISEELVPDGGEANGGLPSTRVDAAGEEQPETSLIVKFNREHWTDELNRIWDSKVRFALPDKDVFVIDAMANPPVSIVGDVGFYSDVGTVLYNMVVNPINGKIYVSNTDARNLNRFEGPGIRLGRDHTVQGRFVENRITVLDSNGVKPRHLNKHINYSQCCANIPNLENVRSVAQPTQMAVTRDGKILYVAAFGSSKVAIYSTAELEADTFTPNVDNQVIVSGGGPSGLVLDEKQGKLYVLTRFDNSVSVIDLKSRVETAHIAMYNPEPASVTRGRRFLYDAAFTSSHGDSSCASCHVYADTDSLAWDLGNPDSTSVNNPGPFAFGPVIDFLPPPFDKPIQNLRAIKGPMTTQSLRGLANHGPMHWRGDRTGGNDEVSAQPDIGTFSEDLAFKKFNAAFVNLNGRHAMLSDAELQAFTNFVFQVTYPPNPIRNLDNSLTPDQAAGRNIYFGEINDTVFNCNGCHVLDPDGNREFGVVKPGFFGTDGRYGFDAVQFFKVPHLRNAYQKVGKFGQLTSPSIFVPNDNKFMGDQVRGFGYLHDGDTDTIFHFLASTCVHPAATWNGDPSRPWQSRRLSSCISQRSFRAGA